MINNVLLTLMILIVASCNAAKQFSFCKEVHEDTKTTCGIQFCPKPDKDKLNIHLIPHTHNDVGWLKTVDQYFYGTHPSTQKAAVEYILDSVINELRVDSKRKFIYVETAFFWKWWMKQHDFTKHLVKRLVNTGQLEFISGGWTMNDEATTNYQSIIDQFTWGLRKLNDSFGKCGQPHVGWQIDPFGHSKEMASIFSQLGFDGVLLGRLDYQDKALRMAKQKAEMIWHSNSNLGYSANLFTGILFNTYSPPPGFCFDVLCSDEPIIDDIHSPDYNVDQRVNEFLNYTLDQAKHYLTKNIIITMGNDFTYQDARMWYRNIDKLIKYANENENGNVNVFYSTPSCYLKALNDANITWPTKDDDFFPYASDFHSYWTGYFSSRPTIKRFERMGNNYLQVCKQLYALADLGPEDGVDLNAMREAMGVLQHHDAITGTEKEAVAKDYARLLSIGFAECDIITNAALRKLINNVKTDETLSRVPPAPLQSCLLLNISQCELSESSSDFVVTLYNPLSHPVSHYVRLPVTGNVYSVRDASKKAVPSQTVPIPDPVLNIPGRFSSATHELVFRAQDLPPLGFRSYFVSKTNRLLYIRDEQSEGIEIQSFSNKNLRIDLNNTSGELEMLLDRKLEISLKQNFYYYVGYVGNNRVSSNRSSGAYIFRPLDQNVYNISNKIESKVYKGQILTEIHQKFSDWVSQVVRLYKDERSIEIEWLVGPIPINGTYGKEVISRYSTPLESNGTFYTDLNGRQLLKRIRNQRLSWKMFVTEPVAGNYYPVTSKILIRDPNRNVEVAVLTDRAQGGTSLNDGEMELMIHRRLLQDDAFGVSEALNETAFGKGLVVRGKHFIIAGKTESKTREPSLAAVERELALKKLLDSWIFVSSANGVSMEEYSNNYKMEYSGLTKPLPINVNIMTIEPWIGRSLLLRLEHVLEKDEDAILSKPVTVNIKELFSPFSVLSAKETTLGANVWLNESERLQWFTESNEVYDGYINNTDEEKNFGLHSLNITLKPMQIRTFILEVEMHKIKN